MRVAAIFAANGSKVHEMQPTFNRQP